MEATQPVESPFELAAVHEVPVEAVRERTARSGFTCLRGLIDPGRVSAAVRTIRDHFDPALDHPAQGQSADAIHRNFQKLTLGGESRTASHDDARFFRTFYNPIWAEDVWGLREAFVTLARVRNRIAGLPDAFAIDGVEPNGLFTAARFHQYPRGGGFFRRHVDHLTDGIASANDVRFFQLVLVMTTKGEDFERGGAFVDLGPTRVCIDDFARPGDIVVYDGRTVHGVEEIDPHVMLDLSTVNGRLAGFATLFEKR